MNLHSYAICASGIVRQDNQDNLYINGVFRKDIADNSDFLYNDKITDSGLYAVADGMGGEMHGELASLVAVQAMNKLSNGRQNMAQYLIERNKVICDMIINAGGTRMGSTFAGIFINGKNADVVNIGDSRIYLLRDGDFSQISRDHTCIRQMIELGVLTDEEARSHPDRHKLTQHLGIFPSEMVIEPHAVTFPVEENDIFLLCSDGLTDMIDDSGIEAALKSSNTFEQKTEDLYKAALQNGGKDNITIVLVQTNP